MVREGSREERGEQIREARGWKRVVNDSSSSYPHILYTTPTTPSSGRNQLLYNYTLQRPCKSALHMPIL